MTIREIAVAFGFEVDRNSEKQAENSIKGLKNTATKLLGSIAVVFSVSKLVNFTKDCIKAASDVQEMQNKFDVVFDGITADVEKWADTFAKTVGRNKNTIKSYLADQQNLLVGFGMTREEGAKLSQEMTSLALDLASFANTDETIAVNAMTKAVMGESEAAKTLGAVLNDSTRSAAIMKMGLTGNYNSLDQLTKMQVNYNAILMQSPDAVGDCIRSINSYEARQRQLHSTVAGFKEFIGGSLLPVMAIFTNYVTIAVRWLSNLSKKIIGATEEENRILKAFTAFNALIKKLQPSIERMMSILNIGMQKCSGFIKTAVDRLGGLENILKVITIATVAFFSVMRIARIVGLIKAMGGLTGIISKLGKVLSIANLKVLAIVAVIVILALIIEDFINFMMGNDSIIGTFFDKAGIGSENARQLIIVAWQKVKDFLLEIWDFIQQAAMMFIETVGNFINKHSESIQKIIERSWGIIKTFLNGVWTFISQLASTLFGDMNDGIDGSTANTKDNLLSVWQSIFDSLSAIFDALYVVGSVVFNAIATVIEVVFGWIQTFWNAWGSRILVWFKVLWDSAGGILNGFLEIVKGVANFIASVFTGDWEGAWDAIKQIYTGVWNAIVSFIIAVWETIKLLFSMGLGAIKSLWEVVWDAISNFFKGIWNGIVSFFSKIWSTITGIILEAINGIYNIITSVLSAISLFFGNVFSGIGSFVSSTFSNMVSGVTGLIGNVKDVIVNGLTVAIDWIKGLPSQALQWGSDIISGIVDGIHGAAGKVTDAVKGIAERIKSFLHFSVPDEGPLTDYQSWMPDFINGLADGISGSESILLDKVKGIANSIATLMNGATANVATAVRSTINNTTSNMTQNVNINNSYSGGSTETQRNVSQAMKKSAVDATTQMARGLAYARG